jgi:heme-degrading monooxygenase HmoA
MTNDVQQFQKFQLAQLNIGRMLAPLDSPTMAEFMARLDDINALAESAPGFVWRLQDEAGNATSLRPFDDDWLIVNMSVWESVEQLKAFTYTTAHAEVMRKRRNWFEPHTEMYLVLWWIPAGHIPSLQEAKERLAQLQKHGESEHAFTFKKTFAAPRAELNVS